MRNSIQNESEAKGYQLHVLTHNTMDTIHFSIETVSTVIDRPHKP